MKETAYILQAALISAWWVGLAFSEQFFTAFQFEQIPPIAFWSFFVPDIVLIAVLSLTRSYFKHQAIEFIILGAMAYASLYCINATILTTSGYLPTTLMVLALAYNIFLCFHQKLFRRSTSSFGRNLIKTLIQVVCIWTLSLAVLPYIILDAFDALRMPSPGVWLYLGIGLFVSFSLLGLSSAYFMILHGEGTPLPLDQTNVLVVSGPYRFVRNPMAVAGIGQGIALAVAFQSVLLLIYSLLGAVVWHAVVRPIEERDMELRFGDDYLSYRRQVSCWIPTFTHSSATTS